MKTRFACLLCLLLFCAIARAQTPPVDPIVGKWIYKSFGPEVVLVFNADGTVGDPGSKLVWKYDYEKFAEARKYRVIQSDGLAIDTVKMTSPNKLEGKTKQGVRVEAKRVLAQ